MERSRKGQAIARCNLVRRWRITKTLAGNHDDVWFVYTLIYVVIEERSSLKTQMEMTSRRVHANALSVGRGEENSIAGRWRRRSWKFLLTWSRFDEFQRQPALKILERLPSRSINDWLLLRIYEPLLNLPDTRSDRSFLFHGYRSRIGRPIGEKKKRLSSRRGECVKFITNLSFSRRKEREKRELNVTGHNYQRGWTSEKTNFTQLVKIRDHVH